MEYIVDESEENKKEILQRGRWLRKSQNNQKVKTLMEGITILNYQKIVSIFEDNINLVEKLHDRIENLVNRIYWLEDRNIHSIISIKELDEIILQPYRFIGSDMLDMLEKLKKNYEKVYGINSEFFDKRHGYTEVIELKKMIFETNDHMEYLKKICNSCFSLTISDLQVWIDTFRDICAKVMKCLSEIKEYECEFKAKVQEIINIVQEVDWISVR